MLMKGFEVAASKGDRLPQNEIEALLRKIGREPPKVAAPRSSAASAPVGEAFVCRRTGRAGTRLPSPPMRGPLGKWIHENIAAETWQEWIGQGTKVINELRLDFSRDRDQEVYDQYMREYLGIDDDLYQKIRRGDGI
jgi:Fe-S cluster biosynthesis and repair protein YggX